MPRDSTKHGPNSAVRDKVGDDEHGLKPLLGVTLTKHKCGHILLPHGRPQLGTPTVLEARATCKAKKAPPWKATHGATRPFEARTLSVLGKVDCPRRQACLHQIQVSTAASPMKPATHLSLGPLLFWVTGCHHHCHRCHEPGHCTASQVINEVSTSDVVATARIIAETAAVAGVHVPSYCQWC